MTFANWVLVAVGLFAILGAVGAFTIAFRRSRAERPSPTAGVSAETRRADRSMAGVRVELPPALAEGAAPEGEGAVAVATAPAEIEPEGREPVGEGGPVELVETQRVVEVTVEESGVSRRQFFNRAIAGTFFAFLGMQGLYYLAFFWPKISGGFGSNVDAGPVDDLKSQTVTSSGSVVPVFIPEARAYVVPAPATLSSQFAGKGVEAGGLFALYQRCVHLGCRVPWCASSVGFECPCHGSKYNSVGEYYAGPAPRNLDRFQVELSNTNSLIIKTGTIIQTPRAPIPSVKYPQGPHCI